MKIRKKTYMEEEIKTIVEITDEGIIMIDYLPADCEVLFNLCIKKECEIIMASREQYYLLLGEMQMWMNNNKSVEEIKAVTDFIKEEWKSSLEIINRFNYD